MHAGDHRERLLALVLDTPRHGYELAEILRAQGFEIGDRTVVYQHLRRMERQGLLQSKVETRRSGPARRVYQVARNGRSPAQ
jgi:DNA-binding PadR family transcriptional regulator